MQSESSEATLIELQRKIEADAKQKTLDDAARRKEQEDSATAYGRLSDRAAVLQNFSDRLLPLLTDFSGSEEEKQARALAAVSEIKAKAVALERQTRALKWLAGILGAAAVGAAIWAVAK